MPRSERGAHAPRSGRHPGGMHVERRPLPGPRAADGAGGPTTPGHSLPPVRSAGRPRTAGWRRVLGQEEQTRPTPLVERLRGTPFSDPRRMDAPTDTGRTLDVLTRIAVLGLRSGSGTAEVEAMVVAAAAALGLEDDGLDVDVTYSSITIGYAPSDGPPVARVQVVRTVGTEYARLSAVHALVLDLAEGRVDRGDVSLRLSQIEHMPKPYRGWIVRCAWGVLAVAVVARLAGGPLALLTAFVMAVAVDAGTREMTRRGAPPFFVIAAGAFIAGAASAMLTVVAPHLPGVLAGDVPPAALVVASGIVVLLPGGTLVAAVEDALRGFPVTAAARIVTVVMTTVAIIAGVVLAIDVARRVGVEDVDTAAAIAAVGGSAAAPWVVLVSTAVAAASAAIAYRTPPRLLLATAAAAAFGQVAVSLVDRVEGPRAFGTFLAAAVVGVLGRVWSLRRRASPLAVVVPGTVMLLPGLTIYTALVEITAGTVFNGFLLLVEAGTVALAIGAGVSLGDSVAAPVERGLDVVSRRRSGTVLRS